MAGFTDETPREYHCNLGPDGRRRDADERPELCRGTVEFIASKEFMVRHMRPIFLFSKRFDMDVIKLFSYLEIHWVIEALLFPSTEKLFKNK